MATDPVVAIRDRLTSAAQARIDREAEYRAKNPPSALRASSIHPCDRNLYYQLTASHEKAPITPDKQQLFAFGNTVEAHVLSMLREAGYTITAHQQDIDVEVRGGKITGHMDGWIHGPDVPSPGCPIEIKGYAFAADQIHDWHDFLSAPQHWLQQVPVQMQLYLYGSNAPWGLLMLFDKKGAKLYPIRVELDLEFVERILRRVEGVYWHLRDWLLTTPERMDEFAPDRCPWTLGLCESCDFAHVCGPRAPLPVDGFLGDPVLVEAAQVYLETVEGKKTHELAEKRLKEYAKALEGFDVFVCGPARITRKVAKNGAVTVKIMPAEGPAAETEGDEPTE